MSWQMSCVHSLGLSAQAISGYGNHHPHDPSDLRRCVDYCEATGIDTAALRRRMTGRSPAWDRLLVHWDDLVVLLRHEVNIATDGRAPRTYREMRRIIADGIACDACDSTGRGTPCGKCKGTGRRSGGRCRAEGCYRGADLCLTCYGEGFTRSDSRTRIGATA